MYYRYTCSACGLVVRTEHPASGSETVACGCGAEVLEEAEAE